MLFNPSYSVGRYRHLYVTPSAVAPGKNNSETIIITEDFIGG